MPETATKKPPPKDTEIRFRVSSAHKRELARAARREGLTLSGFLVRAGLKAARDGG